MSKIKIHMRVVNKQEAIEIISTQSQEFAVIKNPGFVFPAIEIVPLSKKLLHLDSSPIAFVMDMDGTTTTTEELCIHSLEFMIRRMSGKMSRKDWIGLSQEKDYPHIIGNSTTKHIEYLIHQYKSFMDKTLTINSFVYSTLWTLLIGKDQQRKNEAIDTLNILNLYEHFQKIITSKKNLKDEKKLEILTKKISKEISGFIDLENESTLVKLGIEIYYQRYHFILKNIVENKLKKISKDFGKKNLIEPLPGVSIFLPLVKGFLGTEAANLANQLINDFKRKNQLQQIDFDFEEVKSKLSFLGRHFESNPAKVAIVTSSIYFEAEIVLSEIFNQIKEEIGTWNISSSRKSKLKRIFSSYKNYYDAFVTATDAHEIRLKPHRDLYSIALHKLAITPDDFDKVIGFEDSQSGTIALRAAGIGLVMAVPFPQTKGHDLSASSYILHNGLPEFIIKHNCFVKG